MLWLYKTTYVPNFRVTYTVQGILISWIDQVAVATTHVLWSVL